MAASPIVVRALDAEREADALFRTSTEAFSSHPHSEAEVAAWRSYVAGLPGTYPGMLRGAFRDGVYLGGCVIYERELRIGLARVRTGCVGDVATRPEHRRQGAARALMRDALEHGRARGQGLLLLDGISGLYQRFGFADVLDITRYLISRAAVLDLPESDYAVRAATPDDAPALLELYERHYGGYVGGFTRSLELQRYFVQTREARNPVWLALDGQGRPRGYLLMPWGPQRQYAAEAGCDSWAATVALLRLHARLLEEEAADPPEELIWPLPPGSRTAYQLADTLYVTGRTAHHPNEGWLARPADTAALVSALLPELRARWLRAGMAWRGTLRLEAGGEPFALALAPGELSLAAGGQPGAEATLSLEALTQLVFGFRPAWWLLEQPGQQATPDAAALLAALFPPQTAWLAGSDAF